MMPADLERLPMPFGVPRSLWGAAFRVARRLRVATSGKLATLNRYSQASVLQYGNLTILFSIRRKPASNSK